MKPRHIASAALFSLILVSAFFHTEACGPDFEPDIFVSTTLPDDLSQFTQGRLGVLQRSYDSDEYAIAFRYLNGGKLTEAERAPIAPPWTSSSDANYEQYEAQQKEQAAIQPAHLWLLKRAEYTTQPVPNQKEAFPTEYGGSIVFDPNYLNCPDAAFQNAVLTLDKRAATWGKQSPHLADWLQAQDAVFSNCAGKTPSLPFAAPAGSPALLRADRAYQLAAASFYARQYDPAIAQFEAIAADSHSLWQPWGKYLAARALVRKAFATAKPTDPYSGELANYDRPTMLEAQRLLESLLKSSSPTPSSEAVRRELNFIRIRTEPEKRIAEISAAIAGPQTDPAFAQDLADLNFYLIKYPNLKADAPILTWIAAWRGKAPPATSLDLWRASHSLPWLVTALIDAKPSDAATPELLAAAEKIDPASPGYQTVLYHRIRLLMSRGQQEQARTLLDHQLAGMPADRAHSDRNAFLRERFAVARDFSELLHYAPRVDQAVTSGAAYAAIDQCLKERGQKSDPAACRANQKPLEFDEDAVLVLNQKTPLPRLMEAAASPQLPKNLQQETALAAWTRSILLDDSASALKLVPLLPPSLKITAQSATGFPAILMILRNPGLRPVVEPGVSRLDTPALLDSFRDNWWCLPAPPNNAASEPAQATGPYPAVLPSPTPETPVLSLEQPLPAPAVFTQDEQNTAASQYKQLLQLPSASFFLGRRVLDYARSHPADPTVPEALHLTVRMTRYGCDSYQQTPQAISDHKALSKAAFQLLHSRYPNSPWTAKTPYYY